MNKLEKLLWTGILLGTISIGAGRLIDNKYLTYLGGATVLGSAVYCIIADRRD